MAEPLMIGLGLVVAVVTVIGVSAVVLGAGMCVRVYLDWRRSR
jgi:hypothetical protein